MGGAYGKAAYALGRQLNHAPHRLWVHMALTVRDDNRTPHYWGGREDMAMALGLDLPDASDPPHKGTCRCRDCMTRRSVFEAVRKTVAALIQAGLIEVVEAASGTRHTKYRLHLRPGETQPQVGAQTQPQVGAQTQPQRVSDPTSGWAKGEQKETNKGKTSEETDPGFSASPHLRVAPASPEPRCIHDQPIKYLGSGRTKQPACPDCRRASNRPGKTFARQERDAMFAHWQRLHDDAIAEQALAAPTERIDPKELSS